MPNARSREAQSVLSLISWVSVANFHLLEKHKTTLKLNWKGGGFFVIYYWDIPQYGGWQDWNLFQIKVSRFCQLERSNMRCTRLQGQRKGWFFGDARPPITVGIVSSHSTYLKNIKPSKRAQAAFWSYSWCILHSVFFPSASQKGLLTHSCLSRESIEPSKPVSDWHGVWHKACLPAVSAQLKHPLWKALEERRKLHAGVCSAELWHFISDHSLYVTGAASQAFGLLTSPFL